MSPTDLAATWRGLEALRRPASIASIGGFRPPADPCTSWFGKGVGLTGETLPSWNGVPMAPLLQIRTSELPFVPEQMEGTALLVVFHAVDRHVLGSPHGDGWLVREYRDLSDLRPLPVVATPWRGFPISWGRVDDDMPSWDDAWSLLDLSAVNEDEQASERFFSDFTTHGGTKCGGYPSCLQHEAGVDDFVFQINTEPKAGWTWGDRGVGHFHRAEGGPWRLSNQFL